MHCVGRIIGQRAAGESGAKGVRVGVKISDVADAVVAGKPVSTRSSEYGSTQKFAGKKCEAAINTDNGVVIQVNPRKKG